MVLKRSPKLELKEIPELGRTKRLQVGLRQVRWASTQETYTREGLDILVEIALEKWSLASDSAPFRKGFFGLAVIP